MRNDELFDSLDTESRDQEITLGLWLFAPTFVFVCMPAAALFAYSVYTGDDKSTLVFRFLNEYHVALFIPMIVILACLAAAIYLILVKDLIRIYETRRRNDLLRFDDDDELPLSDGMRRTLSGFAATVIVVLGASVLLWNG